MPTKEYYQTHKAEILATNKDYREKNKEKISIQQKRWQEKNRETINEKSNLYYHNHKERIKKTREKYYKSKGKDKRHETYLMNRSKYLNDKKIYAQGHKEQRKVYLKKKFKEDKNYNISIRIRTRLREVTRNYILNGINPKKTKYPVDYKAIIDYLRPFPEDISKYHIDHKIPLAHFKLINIDGTLNEQEIKRAFAPENHQWLTISENCSKGKRYISA